MLEEYLKNIEFTINKVESFKYKEDDYKNYRLILKAQLLAFERYFLLYFINERGCLTKKDIDKLRRVVANFAKVNNIKDTSIEILNILNGVMDRYLKIK